MGRNGYRVVNPLFGEYRELAKNPDLSNRQVTSRVLGVVNNTGEPIDGRFYDVHVPGLRRRVVVVSDPKNPKVLTHIATYGRAAREFGFVQ